MKRKLVWLLILALMAALTPALAEEALTAEEQAYAMANISNDFLIRTETRNAPLFTSVQELDDLGLGFVSDDNKISLICMFDEGQLWCSMLLTSDPAYVRDALYSGCAMMLLQGDPPGLEKVAALLDAWYPDVIAAMDANEFYSQTCYDCEGFDVELMVTPLDDRGRLNLIFYWKS